MLSSYGDIIPKPNRLDEGKIKVFQTKSEASPLGDYRGYCFYIFYYLFYYIFCVTICNTPCYTL